MGNFCTWCNCNVQGPSTTEEDATHERGFQLNILCFGNSLTEGFLIAINYSPYSKTLEQLINKDKKRFKINNCQIINGGVSGVSNTMVKRLGDLLDMYPEKAKGNRNKSNSGELNDIFDFVIILGGTNDIG